MSKGSLSFCWLIWLIRYGVVLLGLTMLNVLTNWTTFTWRLVSLINVIITKLWATLCSLTFSHFSTASPGWCLKCHGDLSRQCSVMWCMWNWNTWQIDLLRLLWRYGPCGVVACSWHPLLREVSLDGGAQLCVSPVRRLLQFPRVTHSVALFLQMHRGQAA